MQILLKKISTQLCWARSTLTVPCVAVCAWDTAILRIVGLVVYFLEKKVSIVLRVVKMVSAYLLYITECWLLWEHFFLCGIILCIWYILWFLQKNFEYHVWSGWNLLKVCYWTFLGSLKRSEAVGNTRAADFVGDVKGQLSRSPDHQKGSDARSCRRSCQSKSCCPFSEAELVGWGTWRYM